MQSAKEVGMMEKGRLAFLFAVFLIFASLVRATDISTCTNISSPGSYFLTGNINISSIHYPTCSDFNASYCTTFSDQCYTAAVCNTENQTTCEADARCQWNGTNCNPYECLGSYVQYPASCISIQSDNVILDCQGKSIYSNCSAPYNLGCVPVEPIGIYRASPETTNIEMENCEVYSSTRGIYMENASGNVLNNIYSHDNFAYLDPSYSGVYGAGIVLVSSDSNLLENIVANNNVFHNAASGLDIINSNYNQIYNFTFNSNTPDGIFLSNSNYTEIWDGSANLNTGNGIDMQSSYDNDISNVSLTGNGGIGTLLSNSANNNITLVNASSNYDGIDMEYSDTNIVQQSTITGNSNDGIYTYDSGNNIVFGNLFNNSQNVFLDTDVYDGFWNVSTLNGGGNFWVPYSLNCTDANGDGFCDIPYDVLNDVGCTAGVNCSGNTDYLPLTDVICGLRGLNITTFDELTGQQIYFNAYITNGTSTMTVNNIWQFNETDCNASLPIGNVTVAISNASYYSPRNYIGYIGLATLQAYLLPLNDSNAVLATFIVQDASTSPMQGIPNALVEVYKDYNGWPVLMASKYTDGIGSVSMYLDSRTQYIANASAVGYFPKSVAAAFSNSSSVIYIYLNRLSYGMGFPNPYSDVTWTLLPANHDLYQDQNSTDFIFTINSKNGTLTNYGMNITNSSGSLLSTGSGSSANGSTLSSIINQSANNGYLNVTIWFLSPSFASTPFVQTVQYIIYPNSNGLGQQILGPNGLIATSGMSIFAMGLLALIISLAITGAFSTIGFSIGKGGVIFTACMTVFAGLGFLTPGLWIELIMIQVSFVIIRWL
jgi:parallel beta-helix repeat protein